jgi:uncharacterized protein (TIGR02145 family)
MKKIENIFIFLHVLFVNLIIAQKVTNVTNKQEQSTIIVSYDLETKLPCKIDLYVSTNGGTTWKGPLEKVTGDVGVNVRSGSKNITWNVLEEFEELRGNDVRFQVRAEDTSYETIQIGNQIWMKKNLDVSTYSNGDIIPEVKDPAEWAKLTTGAWCYNNNDPKNGEIYGKLYNWYAVNDPRGLAPIGNHIPSDNEWDTLLNYLGGRSVAGGKMKEKGLIHWKSPNNAATNSSYFTGLPGGCRDFNGVFNIVNGDGGGWWSSSESNSINAWYQGLGYSISGAYRNGLNKEYGFSVRCLRD